jgi:superfamily II DNA or RNA helicase
VRNIRDLPFAEPPGLAAAPIDASFLTNLPSCAVVLRNYQLDLITKIARAITEGNRRILAQSPTGSGKTHVIATIAAAAAQHGLRIVVLATRTRIVRQLHDRMVEFHVPHGVIAAQLPELLAYQHATQIASVDTLYRRAIVAERMPLLPASVVIFDEAHLALGESRRAVLDRYPDAVLIGFTATPCKVSGRPLGNLFSRLVCGPTVRQLIAADQLVKPRVFAAPLAEEHDLAGISRDSKTDDYSAGELSQLMTRPQLVGDVLANWLRIANGARTIVFCCDKAHGSALENEFQRAGVAAELLTDANSETDREAAISRLERGETVVLLNCFLMSYGVDIPSVECIVLARPTRSVVLYLQAVGRGMRPSPGKDYVTVIDHGRVVQSLGLPTADFDWSLESGNVNRSAREKHARHSTIEQPRTCPDCLHLWLVSEEGPSCANCGWAPVPAARVIQVQAADLEEIGAGPASDTSASIEQFFAEAIGWYEKRWPDRYQQNANRGRGWAWNQTRELLELQAQKPPAHFWRIAPKQPSLPVAGKLMARLIAYAKRKAAA